MSNIAGKTIPITGASSGIGEASARLFSERGANVVLGARRAERPEVLTGSSSQAKAAPPATVPST